MHRLGIPRAPLGVIVSACLSIAVSIALGSSVRAADWVEPPFNPPLGTTFTVSTLRDYQKTSEEGTQKTTENMHWVGKAAVTYLEKTAEGYRVRYVRGSTQVDGASPKVSASRIIAPVVENLELVAITDRNGVPLRLENVEAVRKAASAVIDRISSGKDPTFGAALHRIFADMIGADPAAAVRMTEDLPLMAKAQGAGLTLGEVRKTSFAEDSGMGVPLHTAREMLLLKVDPASKTETVVIEDSVDPPSIRRMLTEVVRRAAQPGEDISDREKTIAAETMSIANRYEFDVFDGMTREMRSSSITQTKGPGYSIIIAEHKTVTLTPQ
jgi:hypothetical protein